MKGKIYLFFKGLSNLPVYVILATCKYREKIFTFNQQFFNLIMNLRHIPFKL